MSQMSYVAMPWYVVLPVGSATSMHGRKPQGRAQVFTTANPMSATPLSDREKGG